MVPMTMKVPVPFEYVFPQGALCLGVEPVKDFDAKGADDQARDKDTGQRVWQVRVLDLDPEAGRFGASKEVKVKIAADQQPVPPASTVPGMPPLVEFTGVTLTPYVNSQKRCSADPVPGKAGVVGARRVDDRPAARQRQQAYRRACESGRLNVEDTRGGPVPRPRSPGPSRATPTPARRLVVSTLPTPAPTPCATGAYWRHCAGCDDLFPAIPGQRLCRLCRPARLPGRCQVAHRYDRSPCEGPHNAVRVADRVGGQRYGCVHHAAVALASVEHVRVYPGSVACAAIEAHNRARTRGPFEFDPAEQLPAADDRAGSGER